MKKHILSALAAVFIVSVFAVSSIAKPGDLFIVVDLDDDEGTGCSIARVDPQGNISEFLTNSEITAASGESAAECDNVGIACTRDSEFYFGDDFGESPANDGSKIMKGGPLSGQVSLFTTGTEIVDVTGDSPSNLSKGFAFGPEGNLYVNERTSTSILRVTVPGSVVSIAVPEAPINDAVGETADLEGGIAVDPDLNIYLVDSDSDDLVSCRPGGPCFVLTSEEEFEDAANVDDVELDEPILLVGDKLYIAEDAGCMCIFVVDINTGVPGLFLSESQLAAALNGESPDPEGGLAVDAEGRIYIGNDDEEVLGSSILRTGPDANPNQLSLFVTSAEMAALYNPADDPEFDAEMCIIPVVKSNVPTLSEWGMVAMAGILGIVGFMVIRRRKATA